MEKIKVLWLSDFNCATGFAQVAHNLIERLAKTGRYEIDVIGINHFGEPYDTEKYPVKAWPAISMLKSKDPRYTDMFGRQRVLDFLGTGKYDLFFTVQDTFIIEGIAGQIVETNKALKKAGHKQFSWVFYYPVDGVVRENWIMQSVALADYPVAYTEFGKRETVRVFPQLKVDVIPHGIDPNVFHPVDEKEVSNFRKKYFGGAADGKFLVTNINRNQRRKDIPRTIGMFAELKKRKPDVLLYLHMNPNDLGGSIYEIARNFKLKPFEDFVVPSNFSENTGFPLDVVNMIYNASDVVVSTTLGEGWGLSSIEAMATKTPIVFPNNTSLTEILGDGERGKLVKSGVGNEWICLGAEDSNQIRPLTDVSDMVEKILEVADNKEETAQMVDRAYTWVQSLNWDTVAQQWDTLFQRAYNHMNSPIITDIGRNDACPDCAKKDIHIKWKKCAKHNPGLSAFKG